MKQFKVTWHNYPGNPRPQVMSLADIRDTFDEVDSVVLDSIGIGYSEIMGGPFDHVEVVRLN